MKKIFYTANQPINLDLGLLIIRIIIGVLMAFYGYEKLMNFDAMAKSEFWQSVNFLCTTGTIPLALTVFAELLCSLFLIVGLLTRISLFFLLFCMAYIFLVVMPNQIISKGSNGYEFNNAFTYFVIYLGLFFTGAGKYSLDKMFFDKKSRLF